MEGWKESNKSVFLDCAWKDGRTVTRVCFHSSRAGVLQSAGGDGQHDEASP